MRIFRSRNVQPGLMLAAALSLSLSLMASASEAYTPEEQQACSGDAFRLCGPAIPDVDRVTACMVANKSQLSLGCRVFFRDDPEPVADADAPLNIRPTARKHRPHKIKKPVT
jgi:hypothetical protein